MQNVQLTGGKDELHVSRNVFEISAKTLRSSLANEGECKNLGYWL